MRKIDRTRPWWRRLVATLAQAPPAAAERLALHYAAELRLAHALARDAESLVRYPHAGVRVLEAAERTRGRALEVKTTPFEEVAA